MHTRLALLLFAAAWGVTPAHARGEEPGKEYVFAVVPQAPPEVMSARWAPIAERVGALAGVPLRLKLYQRFEDLQADVAAGVADLAYLNPIQTVEARRAARYRPVLRNSKPVHGVLVVSRDSPLESAAELSGRELAFIGPYSVCAMALRHELAHFRTVPRFVGTSANVYKHVVLGLLPGGGVLDVALEDAAPEIREKLKVIYRTPPMAPHAVVVHPRVPRAVADRVEAAFAAFARTEEGRVALGRVHLESPTAADYVRDYAPIEHVLASSLEGGPPAGTSR